MTVERAARRISGRKSPGTIASAIPCSRETPRSEVTGTRSAWTNQVASELRAHYPGDWLLRWNLLESLRKLDAGVVLATMLRDDLLDVEVGTPGDAATKAPIARGLRYLGFEPRRAASAKNRDQGDSA